LPDEWSGLSFQIRLRGSRIKVRLAREEIEFTVLEGDGAEVSVRGQSLQLSGGEPISVPLSDQGPRITTPLAFQTGERRPDGTLITATVPQATGARR